MNRTLNVVRMQLVNRQTYLWVPLLILGGSFVISLSVFAILFGAGITSPKYGGGAQAPLWYFLAVGIQALTQTFPFSQAMSVTRREFFLGTLLTAVVSSAVQSSIVVIGGLLERATGGFGVDGYFFYLPWMWEAGPLGAGIVFFTCAMLLFVIGFASATIFKRFGALAVVAVLLGAGVLLAAAAWWVTANGSWPDLWNGVVVLGALRLALGTLAAVAVLAAASFLPLRRAIP